jgi:hypothetical protein
MCIFASKNGKITSYSLTSTTRDITDAVCEIHFSDLELGVGSVSIVDGQCAVGDQFGRIVLFDVVQSAGKILTVISHRKTLTGNFPPAAAAANAAYEAFVMEEDKKRRKRRLEKKKKRLQKQKQKKEGDNDDDDDDENEEEEESNDDEEEEEEEKEEQDEDKSKTKKKEKTEEAETVERVEKHFHAQRMWEANKRAWEERQYVEKSIVAQYGKSERGGTNSQFQVCDRLVTLFQFGGQNNKNNNNNNQKNSDQNENNLLKRGYILVKDKKGKEKRISTTVARQIAREERNRKRQILLETEAREMEKDPDAFLRKKKGIKEAHEKELEANALVAQATATTTGASEQIARIKEASDRLVYSIARPSYGEVITITPVLDFPCFVVSNACGDIYCTTFSCVEPANAEILRWSGSAPRSVVKTAGKSNVVCMTFMRHPHVGNAVTLITGDDLGCMTMWSLEDTMNFFFNSSTVVVTASKKDGRQKEERRLSRKQSRIRIMTENDDDHHHDVRGVKKIDGHHDELFFDDDDEEFEKQQKQKRQRRLSIHHNNNDDDNSQSNVAVGSSAKYFLEESERWLRAPRPQLLSCIQITKNNTSITSLNAVPERNVAIIATGDGKIQVISLFDNLGSRMEAGAILGNYIPHKRFAVKPPIGFRTLCPNPFLIQQQQDQQQQQPSSAQLGDLVLSKQQQQTTTHVETSPVRKTSKNQENETVLSHSRWKKIQESIVGKRIAWFHLTTDVIEKAAFEDEVSALQRQQKDSASSPVASPTHNNKSNADNNSHPDDDIQDDASWEKIVNELLGREKDNNNKSSGSPNQNYNNSLRKSVRQTQVDENNLAFSGTMRPDHQSENFSANLDHVKDVFAIERKNIKDENQNSKEEQDNDDDDDEEERAKREAAQNNIDLNVVRWTFSDPSSTPKAISKKSVMQQVKLQEEEKRKKEEQENGAGGVFALTQNQNHNHSNNKKRKKHVKGANAFEDSELEQIEKAKRAERKRKMKRSDDGKEDSGDSGDEENKPFVVEVLRPRQISTTRFQEKLRWELEFAIEQCTRFGEIPPSSPSLFRQRNQNGENKNDDLDVEKNEETATATNHQQEEPFFFLQHMPRPPRLFPPQVNSALTMPCACDVDVPIPPHGSTSEWIRDAVEKFAPFTVQGRLVADEDENINLNDDQNSKQNQQQKNPNDSDDDEEGDTEDQSEEKKKRKLAKKAKLEQKFKEEKALEQAERRKRKELWGTIENANTFNKALVFEHIQNPDKVKTPIPRKYLDSLFTPRTRAREELAMLQNQQQDNENQNNSNVRPLSAKSNSSSSVISSPRTGNRRNKTKAEKDQEEAERKRQEAILQDRINEADSEEQARLRFRSLLSPAIANGKRSVDEDGFVPFSEKMFTLANRKELLKSVKPFGGSVLAIRQQKQQHEAEMKRKESQMERAQQVQQEFEHHLVEQSTPGWPLQPSALLTPHHSREVLLMMMTTTTTKATPTNHDGDDEHNQNDISEIPSLREQIEMVLNEGEQESRSRMQNSSSHLFQSQSNQRFSVSDIRKFNKEQKSFEKNRFKPLIADGGEFASPSSDFDKKQEPLDQVYGRWNEKQSKGRLWNVANSREKGETFHKILEKKKTNNKKTSSSPEREEQQDISTIHNQQNSSSSFATPAPQKNDTSLPSSSSPAAQKRLLSHLASTPIPEQTTKSHYQTPIVFASSPVIPTGNFFVGNKNHRDNDDAYNGSEFGDDQNASSLFLINEKSALRIAVKKKRSATTTDLPEKLLTTGVVDADEKISSARRKTQQQQQQQLIQSSFVPNVNDVAYPKPISEITKAVLSEAAEKKKQEQQRKSGFAARQIHSASFTSSSSFSPTPMMMKDRKEKLQQVFGNRSVSTPDLRDNKLENFALLGVKK